MTTKQRALAINQKLKELYSEVHSELRYSRPYEFLFAVILSAQTTDKQVNIVTEKLFKKYTKLEDFVKLTQEEFEKDINSIGLYKGKAKNILATAQILHETYNGTVPNTMKKLLELPGVARKTANVVLGELYGINEGIAVDTHVKRLSQKFGLSKETDPKKVEKDLMELIPQEDWSDFALRLILYGRYQWPAKAKDHDGPLAKYIPV